MDFADLKAAIIEWVKAHEGAGSWYQLDRVLIAGRRHLAPLLMPALKELEKEGLIVGVPDPAQPAIIRYRGVRKKAQQA